MARELVGRTLDHDELPGPGGGLHARAPGDQQPDLARRRARPRSPATPARRFPPETGISGVDTPASLPVEKSGSAPEETFLRGRETRQTAYSQPFADSFGNPVFQAQIPLVDRGVFTAR